MQKSSEIAHTDQGPPNDPSWVLLAGNPSIYIVRKLMKFADAQAYAQRFQMNLASVPDHGTNVVMREAIKQFGYTSAWIGFTDEGHEGVWFWVNGDPVTYRNWIPGEPNNDHSENGAAMYLTGQWQDIKANAGGYDLPFFVQART